MGPPPRRRRNRNNVNFVSAGINAPPACDTVFRAFALHKVYPGGAPSRPPSSELEAGFQPTLNSSTSGHLVIIFDGRKLPNSDFARKEPVGENRDRDRRGTPIGSNDSHPPTIYTGRPMGPIQLCELPQEILEHILLSLPPSDILKMKEVSSITHRASISLNDLPRYP